MIVPRYATGDWVAVVTDGSLALLPPGTAPETVAAVWDSLRAGEGLTQQVELLLRGGLRELPPFALASCHGGTAHLIVRGDVEAVVTTADGDRMLSGAQVATWTEEVVADPAAIALAVPGSRDAVRDLPVLSAVVRAAAVGLVLREPDAEPSGAVGTDARGDLAWQPRSDLAGPPAAPAPPAAIPVSAEPMPDPLGDLAITLLQPTSQAVAGRGRPPAPSPVATADPEALDDPDAAELAARFALPAAPALAPATPAAPAVPTPPVPTPPVPTPPVPTPAPAAEHATDDDHDGLTLLSSDVASLRHQLPDWAGSMPGPLAVPTPQTPPPGKIVLSTGLVVALNRPVLIGRAPQVSRVSNADLPRLVTVPSPNQDVSRTHAEVRQEGGHVLVTDLRSTNGVLLLREGASPQRLHPGVATVVDPGVTVDLGDGVTFVVDHGR